MAREIPSAPRVYTTTYDNFKGVDFTNDSTNVWRRRSPSAVNMLPDASGRPFKRTGWEILLSNAQLSEELGVDECTITKCAWFELAGVDHIVIFTDKGVIFYNGEVSAISTDPDCYAGHDRCFFFEGGGTSAFYIYGNFKVWRYDSSFTLTEVTNELYVPTVLVSTSADGVGTLLQGYNLLSNMARIQYHDADLFTYWGSDGLSFAVDKDTYTSTLTKNYSQTYTYDGADWKDENDTVVDFNTLGITLTSVANDGDEVFVVYANGIVLPNNIDLNSQGNMVTVYGSTATQFDTKMEQVASSPSLGEFTIHPDSIDREQRRAWIEFNASQTFADLGEEDIVDVTSPSAEVRITPIIETDTGQAELIGEVI